MSLNNFTFPYPVLGSYDDILPQPKEPRVEVRQDKDNYIFNIELAYDNKEIKQLVEKEDAVYVCEVSCELTKYRRCFKSNQLHFNISIPRKSVGARINFACTITVQKRIPNYTNKGFHPDYAGHQFDLDPGDLLGMFSPFYYNADIEYDKLKAVGTFMEIIETDNSLPTTILNKDKIELKLPKQLYNDFKDNPSINRKAAILHASLVLNSLTYALCRIEHFMSTKWAETIMYRIRTDAELKDFMNQDTDEWEVDKLAQILLGKPYERLFNFLKQEPNQE